MKKLSWVIGTVLAAWMLPGCMSTPGGIAPSSIPITSKDSYTIVQRNAEGSSLGINLLGVIPLGPGASAYDALMDAKKEYHADGLINITAENRYRFYLLFVTFDEMIVSGDAIKFTRSGEEIE